MLAMKSMASGDPVDLQREKRWPNHTGQGTTQGPKGVQVDWNPWEDDAEYSDQEGVCGYPVLDVDISDDEWRLRIKAANTWMYECMGRMQSL